MCTETTLGKFAFIFSLVISCKPVDVGISWHLKRSMFTDGNKTIIPAGLENSTRPFVFTSVSGCRASEYFDISTEN